MLPINIRLDNSLVVDSEWWVNEKSNPDPCLISYQGKNCPPAVMAPSTGGLPSGYSYYLSWYVGAERNKIKLPPGGRWLCLASLNHSLYFDCVNKAENLADAYARLLNRNLDKNVRDRFVTETTDFTDYADYIGKEKAEVPALYWQEIEYSRTDAQVTWEIFEELLPKIQKLPPEVFWSIVAHSNMYTYSHPDVEDWIGDQNLEFNRYEAEFDTATEELVTRATPETCPDLDWSTVAKQIRAPKWRTNISRLSGGVWASGVRLPRPRHIKATESDYLITPTLATAHTPQRLHGQPLVDTTYELVKKRNQKKLVHRWRDKKITVKGNDFGFLLGVRDRDGNRLYPRSKADGGWLQGNCRLFCKEMIELWEKGDIVADSPGAEPILKAIIKMSFWLGVRGNFAETYRWSQNRGLKTYQDQTPKSAMTGRSTSKTCLLFPKDVTKDKIGFTARMVYHHMPDKHYQVGFDFSAQEALIIGLVCKALGDDRLYKRTTTGRLHDDNAEQWGISRSEAKAGFFAGVYGAGAARLSSTIGMSMEAAQAVADGLYGRGGVCEAYLRWIKRNENNPTQIFWNKPAPIVKAGVHLLKDWFIQSTGNAMLDYVVGNLHCDGYQLSQTVHDELWIMVRSTYSEPWNDPAIVRLADRMNELYHQCWLTLAKRLGLHESVVDLPCFHGEVEITNRGLKFYRHSDGVLYEPVIMANPKAADRAESKLGASAGWNVQAHKYAHYF